MLTVIEASPSYNMFTYHEIYLKNNTINYQRFSRGISYISKIFYTILFNYFTNNHSRFDFERMEFPLMFYY